MSTLAQDLLRDRLETLYTERERYGKHLDSVNEDIRDLEVAIAALAERATAPSEPPTEERLSGDFLPCDHKGRGYLLWNEANRAFQCPLCGEVFVPKFRTEILTVPADRAPLPEEKIVHEDASGFDAADPLPDPFEVPVAEVRFEWSEPPSDDLKAALAEAFAAEPFPLPEADDPAGPEEPPVPDHDPVQPLGTYLGTIREKLRASAALVSTQYDETTDNDDWEGA